MIAGTDLSELEGELLRCSVHGTWTHMCGYMDQQITQVACRQLGLSSSGIIWT
jgi:hypothetical protein